MTFTSTSPPKIPRTVTAIAVGRGISFLGDEVALLAMIFRAKDQLGHFGVAAIMIAAALPMLLLAPFAGLLIDRVRTKPVLVVVSLVQAALCLGLAWSSTVMLVPLVALLACGTVIAGPAWQALVPTLVDRSQLPGAMGQVQSAFALAGMAGPFIGGLLVAYFGFHVPLVVDAVSFALLSLVPIVFHLDRRPSGEHAKDLSLAESLAGVRLITSNALLRSLLILVTFFVLALGVINVVEVWFISTALHAGARGYGLLGVCMGAGMLVVGLLSGRISVRFTQPHRNFVAGCIGLCVFILGFSLTTELWQAFVLVFLIGVSNALLNVNVGVLITTHSTDEIRGRVFAAVQGTVSAAQILALTAGGLLLLAFPNSPRAIIIGGALLSAVVLCVTIGPVLRAGAPSPALAIGGGELGVPGSPPEPLPA